MPERRRQRVEGCRCGKTVLMETPGVNPETVREMLPTREPEEGGRPTPTERLIERAREAEERLNPDDARRDDTG